MAPPIRFESRMERSESDEDPPGTVSEAPLRKRKKRAHFSCAECRRLKLKCDRQVPCSNCVRRHCLDLCPNGTRPLKASEESTELRERLEALESILSTNGIALPETKNRNEPMSFSEKKNSRSPRRRSQSPGVSTSRSSRPVLANPVLEQNQGTGPILSSTLLTPAIPSSLLKDNEPISFPSFFPPPATSHIQQVRFDFSDPTASSSSNVMEAPVNDLTENATHAPGMSPDEQSFGTLVISKSGRSKYLGPTAASEWLKDQEVQDANESPPISRAPSPGRRTRNIPQYSAGEVTFSTFPFGPAMEAVSTEYLIQKLPPLDEACVLIDSYYRYFAWHFDVSPRQSFQPIFDRLYGEMIPSNGTIGSVSAQELALVYITMALGALHNLELPPNDPLSDELFALSKSCLAKGKFLIHNTIAGVQTLHVMAHFCLENERGRNGDSAWPLWGLAMRIIQAMGLHRDGARWNLPADVVEERRRVFWECHSADIFQANCFSRPSSISPEYIDTAFPTEQPHSRVLETSEKGFATLKFELSSISGAVLDLAMKVTAPSYSTVTALHERLLEFERNIPYHLRCRAVLQALPSRYPDTESANNDSPEESKRDLHRTFQQFTLSLNVTEAILFLHRPYFVRALHERLPDPTRSTFGQSYLTVVERCNVIIQIVSRIHSLHPNVTARHWYFWYHAFNAAVCVGTLILENPQNPLATFALTQIDCAINLYTAVVQGRASRRMVHNLQWLLRLRQRAWDKMSRTSRETGAAARNDALEDDEVEEDVELLGWRTRLIQRADQGTQTATTISLTSPMNSAASASPNTAVAKTITNALQQHFGPSDDTLQDAPSNSPPSVSTDTLMHQFWDPMLLQDIPDLTGNTFNWWDWDSTSNIQS